jgi:hypothetical protein
MKAVIKDGKLIVECDIVKKESKSGKSWTLATSEGNKPTTAQYEGKVVIVGVNAYIAK